MVQFWWAFGRLLWLDIQLGHQITATSLNTSVHCILKFGGKTASRFTNNSPTNVVHSYSTTQAMMKMTDILLFCCAIELLSVCCVITGPL